MPPVCCKMPALRRPAQGLASSGREPAPALAPAPNNDLFQEFIQTYIEKVRDQAPTALAALAAPATEVKNDADRLLKPQNPDLYYSNL